MSNETATQVNERLYSQRPFEKVSVDLCSYLRSLPADKQREFCEEIYRAGIRMKWAAQWLERGANIEEAIELGGVGR